MRRFNHRCNVGYIKVGVGLSERITVTVVLLNSPVQYSIIIIQLPLSVQSQWFTVLFHYEGILDIRSSEISISFNVAFCYFFLGVLLLR